MKNIEILVICKEAKREGTVFAGLIRQNSSALFLPSGSERD
jgi:hypothetical protein